MTLLIWLMLAVPLAQLVEASDLSSEQYRFESYRGHYLATPSTRVSGVEQSMIQEMRYIDHEVIIRRTDRGEERFHFFMPVEDTGDTFIFVSPPGIIRGETIDLACALLKSM